MDAILDTSIIIEIFLDELPRNLEYGISVITLFELYCGELKEREEIFLEKMPKLDYDERSANLQRA